MKQYIIAVSLLLLGWPPNSSKAQETQGSDAQFYKIAVTDYREKVYASWLGQLVGNAYGLPHENKYIDQPGPETFPFGYGPKLAQLKQVNGAFSDDDTDVEYIYLLQMEKYGPEPSYQQLSDGWKHHIRERVWLANRAALGLMHYGYTPPFTGQKVNNPHWFQIDPQLVNEIWAVTAPGMLRYAAEKSEWAARITNDGWGVEPTIHYGAMFSAAFFESDIYKLIDIGTAALPQGSRFASTVEDMKALYKKYPGNWKQARQEMAAKYYKNEDPRTKTIWNANLNGACGILALLYGKGDFQTTLDMAVVMGFDADNQTATMCGLIGLIKGSQSIPRNLLFPVKEWTKPFNDRYVNVSRFDMPDAGIADMTGRIADIGEKIIFAGGGRKVTENGKEYYLINKSAAFTPPLELPAGPQFVLERGKPFSADISVSGGGEERNWKLTGGTLPEGLRFDDGKLSGTAMKPGTYLFSLQLSSGDQLVSRGFRMVVRGPNLAMSAAKILANVPQADQHRLDSLWQSIPKSLYAASVNIINDGKTGGDGQTFFSITGSTLPKNDYYGYEWTQPQRISSITYHTGAMEEIAGWFTSLNAEYLENGKWKPVQGLQVFPALIKGNTPYDKPHFVPYELSFTPVTTTAIRLSGKAGGGEHWHGKPAYFTAISELEIH